MVWEKKETDDCVVWLISPWKGTTVVLQTFSEPSEIDGAFSPGQSDNTIKMEPSILKALQNI